MTKTKINHDCADAYPMPFASDEKALPTTCIVIVIVASPGPPPVKRSISAYACKAPITPVMARKISELISGENNERKPTHYPAPSSFAASIYSLGTPCSAANIITIVGPIPVHTLIKTTENKA